MEIEFEEGGVSPLTPEYPAALAAVNFLESLEVLSAEEASVTRNHVKVTFEHLCKCSKRVDFQKPMPDCRRCSAPMECRANGLHICSSTNCLVPARTSPLDTWVGVFRRSRIAEPLPAKPRASVNS